jgi:hypothetical protein
MAATNFLSCGARRRTGGGEELGIKRGEGKGVCERPTCIPSGREARKWARAGQPSGEIAAAVPHGFGGRDESDGLVP